MAIPTVRTSSHAIDFGTSNTCIARWNSHAATRNCELTWFISSTESKPPDSQFGICQDASQNKVVVGQAVRDRGLDLTSDSIFPQLQTRDCLKFRFYQKSMGRLSLSSRWFLTELIEKLDVNASDVQQSLVLTVDSFEAYRHWLGRCANFAGGAGADLG